MKNEDQTQQAGEDALAKHTDDLLDTLGVTAPEPEADATSAKVPGVNRVRDTEGRFAPKNPPPPHEKGEQPALEQQAQAQQPEPEKQTEQQAQTEQQQPEAEVDWRARAQDLEQQLARSRQGFQRTITELRQGLRAPVYPEQAPHGMQPMPQVQQPTPQQPVPDHIQIEFNEHGQPVIPRRALEPLLQQMAPRPQMDPASIRRAALSQFQQSMVMRDPVSYAPAVNRVLSAAETADQLVLAKQTELGGYRFRNAGELIDFMDNTGVTQALRESYPDILADDVGVESLIEGMLMLEPRKLERLVERARAGAQQSVTQPQRPAQVTQLRPLPASKPRPHVSRGTPETLVGSAARLAQLDSMNPMDMTAAEAKEYERLLREESGKRAG